MTVTDGDSGAVPAPKPPDEEVRLRALRQLQLLDTPPEERFDRIVRLTRRLLDVPIALISLVDDDRQWFKAVVGLDICETSRDVAFCSHAILGDEPLVVSDTFEDPRFATNPLVTGEPHIRFYAGMVIHAPGGQRIGTLCAVDTRPRFLSVEERDTLADLRGVAEREVTALALAAVDPLTGLPNRAGLQHLARHAIAQADRNSQTLTAIFVDIDGLKSANDAAGHEAGDALIADLGRILRDTIRESDIAARVGGDEFFLLCTAPGSDRIVERVRQAIEERNALAEGPPLAATFGSAPAPPGTERDLNTLMGAADRTMYRQRAETRST